MTICDSCKKELLKSYTKTENVLGLDICHECGGIYYETMEKLVYMIIKHGLHNIKIVGLQEVAKND